MGRLTEKEYWNSIYKPRVLERQGHPLVGNLKSLVTRLFGERCLRNYADYLLWDVIFGKYMPKTKGAKVLEIGSAPGNNLVRLSQTFGFVPYGVEYTDSGVELNRRTFDLHNIDTENVIHADFFSDEFHKQYKGCFDIVFSVGFIEHFTDIEGTIEKHINLLTKGGYLIVIIPNLRGANHILGWIFHKEVISMINTDIMRKENFSEIFDNERLSMLFCDYCGTFNFGLFNTKRKSPLRFVLTFCAILQRVLNVVFYILFRNKGAESRLFSPYLIFIGVKK